MARRKCIECGSKIRLMSPPVSKQGYTQICSEVCRKIIDGEITPEQGKVIRRAAVQKSTKEN